MAKSNIFNSVFEKSVNEPSARQEIVYEKASRTEEVPVSVKTNNLFILKDLPEQDRKPITTIIFSKRNLAFLKKMAIDENANMSELVNRWLERLQAEA